MSGKNLDVLIDREEKNIERYREKRAEFDEKIKKAEARLNELKMMKNSNAFNALAGAVKDKGLSMEDVLLALQKGDFLALQEQMEAAQVTEESV